MIHNIEMAKHGKKKIRFAVKDLEFASFFLDYIRNKDFYVRLSGSMKYTGQIEFTLVGSSNNVRMGILKIKKLYRKAIEMYEKDRNFILQQQSQIDGQLEESEIEELLEDDKSVEDFNIRINLKKLKFDEI